LTDELRKKLKDYQYGSRPGMRADSEFIDRIITFDGGIGETGYQYLGETKCFTGERHGIGKAIFQRNDKISVFEGWWKDDA